MKRKIVAVFDSAAGTYGQPIFAVSNGVAIRSMRDEVNRSALDNPMYQHPEDFVLYDLGEFDDNTGAISSLHDQPQVLARAKDMKE